jgi:hypothetical protein
MCAGSHVAWVYMGPASAAHVLEPAELRPCSRRPRRAEGDVQAARGADDVAVGSTPAHLRELQPPQGK